MFAWVTGERKRFLAQESMEEEGALQEDLGRGTKGRELSASKRFKVCPPIKEGARRKAVADTLWVLTWKVADGKKTVKA